MRIRQHEVKETRWKATRPVATEGDALANAAFKRAHHNRYFVFTDKFGGRTRFPFPQLIIVDASREWGQAEARKIVKDLIAARGQIQAPAAFIAECMRVAPEILYRLEGTDRDITLSSALRYAKALGLEFQIVETPT